jgi:hypothetical protein
MKHFVVAILLLLTLQGCADLDELFASSGNAQPVDEVERAKYEAFPFENMAPSQPPPPRQEYKGQPPGQSLDEFTWRNGYWKYVDPQGFTWMPGYWMKKPAYSAAWKQDMWFQRTYGWTLEPGHWE